MAVRKLKPIEERDPYADAVLDAFDRLEPAEAPGLCIAPACADGCSCCEQALAPEQIASYARRYAYLRERDLGTIQRGGVFAGMTPQNVVLNGDDLDAAIDAAMAASMPANAPHNRQADGGTPLGGPR